MVKRMTNGERFKDLFGLYATEVWAMPEKDFLEWLNTLTTPAEPIKHGRWSRERLPSTDGGSYEVFRCNLCNEAFNWRTAYCPNCGADMRGEQNE